MRIRYINLDRVPDRAAFMERQFQDMAVFAERLRATDAAEDPEIEGYNPHSWGPRWELTISEQACFDSHRRIWRESDGTGEPVVVLEDDLHLSRMFPQALRALSGYVRDGAIIKLDGVRQAGRYGSAMSVGENFELRRIRQTVHSAGCYLVTPKAAAQLAKRSDTFCDHLDDFVFNPNADWALWQLFPAVAAQSVLLEETDVSSTIAGSERTSDRRINAPKKKGPVLYRLAKEVRRSARKVARAAGGDRRLLAKGGYIGAVPLAPDLGPYA